MSLKKIFQRLVFISGLALALGIAPSFVSRATTVEDIEVPGLEALLEIEKEQQETVEIGAVEQEPEYAIPSNQVSIGYTGKIDATTGEAVIGNAVNVGEDYFILKNGELAYNARNRQYHILCGDRGVYCNVPSGAMLSNRRTIQFTPDEGVTYEMFYNGEPVKDTSKREFQESGEYLLTLYNHAESKEYSVAFCILDETENDVREFRLPYGFEYTEVLLDGVKKSVNYNNYYDFLEEGNYQLQWENSRIDQAFVTSFTLDLSAPTLRLPEVRNGVAAGEVTFSDLEEGAYIHWIRDYRAEGFIDEPSEVLSQKGSYVMRVYDKAGNYTEYSFVLEGYFDVNAVLAVLLLLILAIGFFLYCRRLRKHMRVG